MNCVFVRALTGLLIINLAVVPLVRAQEADGGNRHEQGRPTERPMSVGVPNVSSSEKGNLRLTVPGAEQRGESHMSTTTVTDNAVQTPAAPPPPVLLSGPPAPIFPLPPVPPSAPVTAPA